MNALVALFGQGQLAALERQAEALTQEYPGAFVIWNILGIARQRLGNVAQAIAAYRQALAIKPDYAEAHSNLGAAFQAQGRLDEAVAAYQQALAIKPESADALHNLGLTLRAQGRHAEAIAAYRKVLVIKPELAEAHNNLGVLLHEQGRLEEAVAAFLSAIRVKPNFAEAYSDMGAALQEQGKPADAEAACRRALAINPNLAEAHNNLGNALTDQGRLDEAAASYQRALAIKPHMEDTAALLLSQLRQMCRWQDSEPLQAAHAHLGVQSAAIQPFPMLAIEDNPARQLARSQKWVQAKYKQEPLPLPAKPVVRPQRLRIGYFSADFHDHPNLYLTSGLLREHDTSRFEVFAYSYGRNEAGDLRRRAARDVAHFIDVKDMPDRELVDLARSHALDIAIDRNGYTEHSRSGLFQWRMAPIQVNYLGYPSTMGADFIDYIIADPVLIPGDQRRFYTERMIYLPHSYMPYDNRHEIASAPTTRADFGLPEKAFVFCCLNNVYKISPREFDIWMRLLAKVEGSILWLLKANKWAEENLRKQAQARGVDAARLVFAERLPHAAYLARYRHADLFIDTFNYNACTMASDALWSGLPVVTRAGQQFVSRVGASLLNAVGLPELITTTDADYEALILALATDPARLQAIRTRLAANRLEQPLFDTRRYTRNFEHGLRRAYDGYIEGQPPRDIAVQEGDD